jgi:hypothetical protein
MSTVEKLIEKLKQLPQDAIVEVGKEVAVMGGYATIMEHHPIDLEDISVHDFTKSDPVRYPLTAGKIIVCLNAK